MKNNIILSASDLAKGKLTACSLADGAIVLNEGEVQGIIESEVVEGLDVTEAVGTFNAQTDPFTTVNLQVSLKVEGKWSRYFSYGYWGLGKINFAWNEEDELVRSKVDEILVAPDHHATALKVRILLDRADQALPSPSLCQVTIACLPVIDEASPDSLPERANWDVPCLNQNMVPVIGGEMCSATTVAMLLMSKGMSFPDPLYPQRSVAHLVADAGHHDPTFGNWANNVDVIGGCGFKSEFLFMSLSELKHHLATVGPLGASIKGQTDYYYTAGHLIVVTGYEETKDGTVYLVNDPNVNARFGKDEDGHDLFVRIRMSEEVFVRVWRHAVYTIR